MTPPPFESLSWPQSPFPLSSAWPVRAHGNCHFAGGEIGPSNSPARYPNHAVEVEDLTIACGGPSLSSAPPVASPPHLLLHLLYASCCISSTPSCCLPSTPPVASPPCSLASAHISHHRGPIPSTRTPSAVIQIAILAALGGCPLFANRSTMPWDPQRARSARPLRFLLDAQAAAWALQSLFAPYVRLSGLRFRPSQIQRQRVWRPVYPLLSYIRGRPTAGPSPRSMKVPLASPLASCRSSIPLPLADPFLSARQMLLYAEKANCQEVTAAPSSLPTGRGSFSGRDTSYPGWTYLPEEGSEKNCRCLDASRSVG